MWTAAKALCFPSVWKTGFPERLENWIGDDNPVRVIDLFVDELDLGGLGFGRVQPLSTGRPAYHPSVLLKLYIYGYLNRVQSSRRLYPLQGWSAARGRADESRRKPTFGRELPLLGVLLPWPDPGRHGES